MLGNFFTLFIVQIKFNKTHSNNNMCQYSQKQQQASHMNHTKNEVNVYKHQRNIAPLISYTTCSNVLHLIPGDDRGGRRRELHPGKTLSQDNLWQVALNGRRHLLKLR